MSTQAWIGPGGIADTIARASGGTREGIVAQAAQLNHMTIGRMIAPEEAITFLVKSRWPFRMHTTYLHRRQARTVGIEHTHMLYLQTNRTDQGRSRVAVATDRRTLWQIDPKHTLVEFTVVYLAFTTVKGQFRG
ncbi:MAG TPA: hypothetical protein VIU62_13435 [Chloroflexota bacterium]